MREMHSQVDQLTIAAVNQENSFKALATHIEKQQGLLASTPTIRPVDPDIEHLVTSRFDYRMSPFTNAREFHKGYDISTREGTPIHATAAGIVTFAGDKGPARQRPLIIDHGHGITTTYGHCSRILKLQGEKGAPLGHDRPSGQYRQQHGSPPALRGGPPRSPRQPRKVLPELEDGFFGRQISALRVFPVVSAWAGPGRALGGAPACETWPSDEADLFSKPAASSFRPARRKRLRPAQDLL